MPQLLCPLFLFSILFAQISPDTLKPPPKESLPLYEKSPGKAMLFSALLPGGGQFYTENYLKGALFLLGEGAMVYFIIREKDREKRSNLIWWAAALHIFNIADAYVSAHLYKFRENRRISLSISPGEIALSLKIPISPEIKIGLLCARGF